MSSPHSYTEADLALLHRYYNSGEMSHAKLAITIGISYGALKWKAACLGLARTNVQRTYARFTDADDKIMISMVGDHTIGAIAARVGRSPCAVSDRLQYLGVSYNTTSRDGWYTLTDVAQILGMSENTVRRLIRNGAIKAKLFYGNKSKTMSGNVWQVSKDTLRDYIRKHPRQLNGRRIDMISLVEILAGVIM